MNERSLNKILSSLPIGKVRYFDSIGSTNDEALAWAANGAADLSIVIADEQSAGRGRLDRKWFTPGGSALAFSIILRPSSMTRLSRFVGLAGLSIVDACLGHGLSPRLKWPNDVLLDGKKVAGILIETVWSAADVDSLVIGMGINVGVESVPPAELLNFPATSIEEGLGRRPDRGTLLHDILLAFITRRPQMESDLFLKAWEDSLAYRGEQIQVRVNNEVPLVGALVGLAPDGSLRLRGGEGDVILAHVGDVSLRPVHDRIKTIKE